MCIEHSLASYLSHEGTEAVLLDDFAAGRDTGQVGDDPAVEVMDRRFACGKVLTEIEARQFI